MYYSGFSLQFFTTLPLFLQNFNLNLNDTSVFSFINKFLKKEAALVPSNNKYHTWHGDANLY